MKSNSVYLKAITGVLLIDIDQKPQLCCIEEMKSSKFFNIGQMFNAVAVLNNKTPKQYGKLWPSFRDVNGDVSKEWNAIQSVHQSCENDYEFLQAVCKQLQEEVPEVVSKNVVQKRLDEFNIDSAAFVKANS